MGEFGVINIDCLDERRLCFKYLSRLLDYPEQDILDKKFLDDFDREYPNTDQKLLVRDWIVNMQSETLFDLKREYTDLFELNKRFTLYFSYYKFEDSRQRGSVIAKLKMLYEMFGFSIEGTELADYLPLMLEFLYLGDWDNDDRQQDIELVFQVIEDGTFNILKNRVEYEGEAYLDLISILRKEAKSCIALPVKKGE